MYFLLFFCLSIIVPAYCEDRIIELALKIKRVDQEKVTECSVSNGNNTYVTEGSRIIIKVTSKYVIHYARLYDDGQVENLNFKDIESDVNKYSIELQKNNVTKDLNGKLEFLTLETVTGHTSSKKAYNNSTFTLTTCVINVFVKAEYFLDKWIYISVGVGSMVVLIIIGQCVALIYFKSKAQKFPTLERLSDGKNAGKTARYSTMPGQKVSLKLNLGVSSRGESGIYETLESVLPGRDQPPEPPTIETLPRKPKSPLQLPVEKKLDDGPSTPRPLGKHLPQVPPKHMIKTRVPSPPPPCDDETYECPPEPPNSKSETLPNPGKSTLLQTLSRALKNKPTTIAKVENINKRSTIEKIKTRPPLPLPTEEVYEDMKPVPFSTSPKLPPVCLPPVIPKTSPVQQRINAPPKKPAKPLAPPPSKKKPVAVPVSSNVTNELDNVFKKRRNVSEINSSPAPIPRPQLKASPKLAPILAAQSPMLTARLPMLTTQSPMLPAQSPMLAGQSPMLAARSPILAGQSPILATNSRKPRPRTPPAKPPPRHIPVEEIDSHQYSDDNSSDEEWIYEPLPQYNIYSM